MLVPFEQMPKTSRLWIYQSDRPLNDEESRFVVENLTAFLEQWAAHGQGLFCSGQLLHDHFLVLTVDHNHHAASGCSIDSSVNFVKQLGSEMNVNWFNRTNVAVKIDDQIVIENQQGLKDKISKGLITGQTPTFNNLVENVDEFESGWLVPAKETWIGRFFAN